MTGDPFAGLLYGGDGALLPFGGNKQFRVRKLEFNHISGNIDIGITHQLFYESVHKRVPLPLDEKTCLVFFELKYFYNHAPMVGKLKTIKVWVAPDADCGRTVFY